MNRSMTAINICLEYIEGHIKERMLLDNIADSVGISKFSKTSANLPVSSLNNQNNRIRLNSCNLF
jgi:hypothetical protein